MGLFRSEPEEDKVMGSFILTEIRDLRKGMEGRDGELRGEIAAVRDAVATLSESVSHSHSEVSGIKKNVDTMGKDLSVLRQEVDDIQKMSTVERVQKTSAWNGPKKILGIILALGGGSAAILSIAKFWPYIVTFIAV